MAKMINPIIVTDLINQAMDMFIIPERTVANKECYNDADIRLEGCVDIHPMESGNIKLTLEWIHH